MSRTKRKGIRVGGYLTLDWRSYFVYLRRKNKQSLKTNSEEAVERKSFCKKGGLIFKWSDHKWIKQRYGYKRYRRKVYPKLFGNAKYNQK